MNYPLSGSEHEKIGWLLEQVLESGGVIPTRYQIKTDRRSSRKPRSMLMGAIRGAFLFEYIVQEQKKNRSKVNKHLSSLSSLEGQLSRALFLLENDDLLLTMLAAHLPEAVGGRGLGGVLEGIKSLRGAAAAVGRDYPNGMVWGHYVSTPQAALMKELAVAYKEGLDADPIAGTVKRYNDFGGPFPAFIRAAFHLEGRAAPQSVALTQAIIRHVMAPNDRP